MSDLKDNFDHFDSDDNGMIDRIEFGRLLAAMGAEMSEEEVDIGFEIIDSDNNGGIDFQELERWWLDRL